MANNYTQFCARFTGSKRAVKALIAALVYEEDGEEELACQHTLVNDKCVILYSDESCNIDAVADAVCGVQEKFKLKEPFTLQWADTCSSNRVDEFGGGALVCHEGSRTWLNTNQWVAEQPDLALLGTFPEKVRKE